MKQHLNNLIELTPILFVAILIWIAVAQFIDARHELEQSRAECYASIGKDACESVR